MLKKFAYAATVAVTLAGTTAATMTPAAAWCRWGGCGGGWGAPVAAGLVAGAIVGAAAASAARGPGYRACPIGYHLGPYGRACIINR